MTDKDQPQSNEPPRTTDERPPERLDSDSGNGALTHADAAEPEAQPATEQSSADRPTEELAAAGDPRSMEPARPSSDIPPAPPAGPSASGPETNDKSETDVWRAAPPPPPATPPPSQPWRPSEPPPPPAQATVPPAQSGQWQQQPPASQQWQQGQWQQPPPGQQWQQPPPGQRWQQPPPGQQWQQPPPGQQWQQPPPYPAQQVGAPARPYPPGPAGYSTSALAALAGLVLFVFGVGVAIAGAWTLTQGAELARFIRENDIALFDRQIDRATIRSVVSPMPGVLIVLGLIQLLVGLGVFAHQGWARALGALLALLGVLIGALGVSVALAFSPDLSVAVLVTLVILFGYGFVLLALIAGGSHFRRRYPGR